MPQQRDYFRIPYPVTERPRLVIGASEFEVVDLSESGARIELDGEPPAGAESFPAIVRFKDGTTVKVVAVVQRQEHGELVLRFADNLPYAVIAGQQRRLLQLYPRDALAPR
jgi:hypothetical protein